MKTSLRVLAIVVATVVVLFVTLLLYVSVGDLGRHKGRIERFVTQHIGRPFAIDGRFSLKLVPGLKMQAQMIRIGNAPWSPTPQMVQVGSCAVDIDLWSLVSGPVVVRSLELRDVTILLEKDRKGNNNWTFGSGHTQPAPEPETGAGLTQVPVALEHTTIGNLRAIYRVAGQKDMSARIDSLTIQPGSGKLLGIDGKGSLDGYPATLQGEAGPLKSLVSGRDIRMAIKASLGNLQMDVRGTVGRLDPLAGTNLDLTIDNPDLGGMLGKLRLPRIADGPLHVKASLQDAGNRTRVALDAKAGELFASVTGSLATLGLRDSELDFKATAADAARLAAVFDIGNVPAKKLDAAGHLSATRRELKFTGVSAALAGVTVRVDGAIPAKRSQVAAVRFNVASENLAQFRQDLPALPITVGGQMTSRPGLVELKNLVAHVGKSDLQGSMKISGGSHRSIEADLGTPLLDLSPFMPRPEQGIGPAPPQGAQQKKLFLFPETPLPFAKLQGLNARLHFAATELRANRGLLKDVDAAITVEGGAMQGQIRAAGGYGGNLEGSVDLVPAGTDAARLKISLRARELRSGFAGDKSIGPAEAPATSLVTDITSVGGSPRQLASAANGRFLLTQGHGKAKSGALDMVGGGVIGQLFGKLNPFARQDPFTEVDCLIARMDIVGGKTAVAPVLMQTTKVTVTARGKIDLHTEALEMNFNTQPRKGIGISPGMFTNPFLELRGTLASPTLGVGAKGMTSGALAAATGGITVLAKGMVDRVKGQFDQCAVALELARQPAGTAGTAQ